MMDTSNYIPIQMAFIDEINLSIKLEKLQGRKYSTASLKVPIVSWSHCQGFSASRLFEQYSVQYELYLGKRGTVLSWTSGL